MWSMSVQVERRRLVVIGQVAELKGDGFEGRPERIFGCLTEDDESWKFGDRQHDARRPDRLDADHVPLRHGSVASLRRRLGAETQQAAREYSARAWEVFDGAWVIREGHAPDCAGLALHSRQGLSAARLPDPHPPVHAAAGQESPSLLSGQRALA